MKNISFSYVDWWKKNRQLPKLSLGPYNKMVVQFIWWYSNNVCCENNCQDNLTWWGTVPQKLNKHWRQSGLKSGGARTYKSSGQAEKMEHVCIEFRSWASSLAPLLISIELGSVFPCIDLFWFFSMPVKKHQKCHFCKFIWPKKSK